MRIQSVLVVALVESDLFDEHGLYLGTDQVQYRAQDLDEASALLRKIRRLIKKGEKANGVQQQPQNQAAKGMENPS